MADKLIGVFRQRNQDDWRKLIAFSKQWPKLAPVVLSRWAWRACCKVTCMLRQPSASQRVGGRKGKTCNVQCHASPVHVQTALSQMQLYRCRLEERSKTHEDPGEQLELRKLRRKLSQVSAVTCVLRTHKLRLGRCQRGCGLFLRRCRTRALLRMQVLCDQLQPTGAAACFTSESQRHCRREILLPSRCTRSCRPTTSS